MCVCISKHYNKMNFMIRAKRIFYSLESKCGIAILAFFAVLTNMYTGAQHFVFFRAIDGIFVAAHVIIALFLIYFEYWIIMEKPRSWKQDSSLWIIVTCVVVIVFVTLIEPGQIFIEQKLTTLATLALLITFGVLVLSVPNRPEEQPMILPTNEVSSSSESINQSICFMECEVDVHRTDENDSTTECEK